MAQLNNSAKNGTVPHELAATVRSIVNNMPTSAKLNGLGSLIEQLKKENQDGWRLVVFTQRRETQTTIQAFLEAHGLKVGIINGDFRRTQSRNYRSLQARTARMQGDRINRGGI